jgi:Protein of unknown function (DUF3592)
MEIVREAGRPHGRRFDHYWLRSSWWTLLITLPWAIGLAFSIYVGLTDHAIAQREQAAQGMIAFHEPANHNGYGYTFSANGKSYSGWDIPTNNEPTVGQQVLVYYDPKDPNKNALSDFGDLTIKSFGPIPLLMFGIGFVALFIRSRMRRNSGC